MKKALILINFKTYEEGTGRKGLKLAKAILKFKSDKYVLAVAPQLVDLKEVVRENKGLVFAQHIDGVRFGSHTGAVLGEAVKGVGAKGVVLNHSEKRLTLKEIKLGVEMCRDLELVSVVCAGSLSVVKKVVKFEPDYIAYEPKRLIGGNVSVTTVNPKVIKKAVEMAGRAKTKLLVGAGVHARKDIVMALELGASGVLMAHKVVKAKKVKKVLEKLLG